MGGVEDGTGWDLSPFPPKHSMISPSSTEPVPSHKEKGQIPPHSHSLFPFLDRILLFPKFFLRTAHSSLKLPFPFSAFSSLLDDKYPIKFLPSSLSSSLFPLPGPACAGSKGICLDEQHSEELLFQGKLSWFLFQSQERSLGVTFQCFAVPWPSLMDSLFSKGFSQMDGFAREPGMFGCLT